MHTVAQIIEALQMNNLPHLPNGDFIITEKLRDAIELLLSQKAVAQIKFPLPSEWIADFKRDWYKDNDRGALPKKRVDELWSETERVCGMIYKYQREAFEKQQQSILSLLSQSEVAPNSSIATMLRELNPYPSDVFTEPTEEEWKSAGTILKDNGIIPDRIFGKWGRMVWNNCIDEMEELTESQSEQPSQYQSRISNASYLTNLQKELLLKDLTK